MFLPPDDPLLGELAAWRGQGSSPTAEAWSPGVRIPSVGDSFGRHRVERQPDALTVPRLVELHTAGGQGAIRALSRRDLRRTVELLAAVSADGRPLLHRERLADDVLIVAREQLAARDVARGFVPALLTTWPPGASACAHAAALLSAAPPPWLAHLTRGRAAPVIEAIWETLQRSGPSTALITHRLPPQFWRGEWCGQVLLAGRGRVTDVALARMVLALGDGIAGIAQLDMALDVDLRTLNKLAVSPVSSALREAVRTAVAAAQGFDTAGKREIAAYIAKRIGDPFRGGVRWEHIEEERVLVRTWLAARFLRAFFDQLRPAEASYQWQERADFWTDYAGRVTAMVLFVGDDIRPRLQTREMLGMLSDLKSVVAIAPLQGKGGDGAALWMVFQDGGASLTALEWNANGAMQCSPGLNKAPSGRQSPKALREAGGAWRETHQGDWQAKFRVPLSYYKIYPTRN